MDKADEIRLEQQIKKELRAAASASRPSPVWVFLNSTFGIFLLSSVFISAFSWGYSQWSTSRAQHAEKEKTWNRLKVEVANRLRYVEKMTTQFQSRDYGVIRTAIYGYDPQANVNPSWIRHYAPVFPEYKERSLSSLIWELETMDDSIRREQIDKLRNISYQTEYYFDRLEYSEVKHPDKKEPDEFYNLPAGDSAKLRSETIQPLEAIEKLSFEN
jgi:hypothetical protein